MMLLDWVWFPPLLFGIAMVIGSTGDHADTPAVGRSVFHTFLMLTFGILAVGLVIHGVASVFSG